MITISEDRRRIAELEQELAKYTGAEANEYGQTQQRMAGLIEDNQQLKTDLDMYKSSHNWRPRKELKYIDDIKSCKEKMEHLWTLIVGHKIVVGNETRDWFTDEGKCKD